MQHPIERPGTWERHSVPINTRLLFIELLAPYCRFFQVAGQTDQCWSQFDSLDEADSRGWCLCIPHPCASSVQGLLQLRVTHHGRLVSLRGITTRESCGTEVAAHHRHHHIWPILPAATDCLGLLAVESTRSQPTCYGQHR